MAHRSSHGSKPLSAKGAALLAELKGHAPERKSQYIEGLVEAADRRKRESEIAFEKKMLREDEAGEAKMQFVTKAYEDKLSAIGDESQGMLKRAERVDSAAHSHNSDRVTKSVLSVGAATAQELVPQQVDATELIRRREARRIERKVPLSTLSDAIITEARERAIKRLAIST